MTSEGNSGKKYFILWAKYRHNLDRAPIRHLVQLTIDKKISIVHRLIQVRTFNRIWRQQIMLQPNANISILQILYLSHWNFETTRMFHESQRGVGNNLISIELEFNKCALTPF